ncbi:protein-glutamine gamma-glutamyltransferase [Halalkalibacter urbisdiaboli]|uniref:protein-glutamine gamma-glutamyltransferase n=1 Tax=Halalkalibacter urbisdiaboli TaxID=1960589 RepID=UPI0013FDD8A8|nr:protein-glutamine gamma-glutamyltransferase [Halalkalibacter urbisdiaboli]
MIKIKSETKSLSDLIDHFEHSYGILKQLDSHKEIYQYSSLVQLQFEVNLRELVLNAALALDSSSVSFATFKEARCNEEFWRLTDYGGFKLKQGVVPSKAIQDIFINSNLYAFECATAMIIVLYKAVLDAVGKGAFNDYFQGLLLYSWEHDKDLGIHILKDSEPIYGDILYFNNPDVNPDTSYWRGLNVIYLSNDLYYGHDVGVLPADKIIELLNEYRKPNATKSAYLMDEPITRLDYKKIYRLKETQSRFFEPNGIYVSIGSHRFSWDFEL